MCPGPSTFGLQRCRSLLDLRMMLESSFVIVACFRKHRFGDFWKLEPLESRDPVGGLREPRTYIVRCQATEKTLEMRNRSKGAPAGGSDTSAKKSLTSRCLASFAPRTSLSLSSFILCLLTDTPFDHGYYPPGYASRLFTPGRPGQMELRFRPLPSTKRRLPSF